MNLKRGRLIAAASAAIALAGAAGAGVWTSLSNKKLDTATADIIAQLQRMHHAYMTGLRVIAHESVSAEQAAILFAELWAHIRVDTTPWDLFPAVTVNAPTYLKVHITGPVEVLMHLQRKIANGASPISDYRFLEGNDNPGSLMVEMEVTDSGLIKLICDKLGLTA